MRGGDIDQKFEIQHNQPIRQKGGQLKDNWVKFGEVWGEPEQFIGGRDHVMASQRTALGRLVFKCRFYPGVTPKMRLYDGTNTYEIDDVGLPDRRRSVRIECHTIEVQSGA